MANVARSYRFEGHSYQGHWPSFAITIEHTPNSPTTMNTLGAAAIMTNGKHGNDRGQQSPNDDQQSIQVVDEDQNFKYNFPVTRSDRRSLEALTCHSEVLSQYLIADGVSLAGFNYHVVSVFGSQSTGKSTLLNHLFGTEFEIMCENERRQTTKGIWMSRNSPNNRKRAQMASNILIMDVEGTDGRERGEDQDFERKAALFALATSEVLIINIWEHQVGLYQGANMGLLKVVFEVNLELFLKGKPTKSTQKSLLFFVIRDHLGTTPLSNLRNTLLADLNRIWAGLNKPSGLEQSRIEDYFDFDFATLPHKILQPERFVEEASQLGTRFRESQKGDGSTVMASDPGRGVFLPQYHRRVPADGFSVYAYGVWEQIVNNKDLDLPTQQELLAQFRCDEIMREVTVTFDTLILPYEERQSANARSGAPSVLNGLGAAMRSARQDAIAHFETEAGRYLKPVYVRKHSELENKLDARLKILFSGQLSAAHKVFISKFSDSVGAAIRSHQKKGANYDFGEIVSQVKASMLAQYTQEATELLIDGATWSNFSEEFGLFRREIDDVTRRLRQDELRRLASRVDKWVRTRLGESIGLQFNLLSSTRDSLALSGGALRPSHGKIWDKIWQIFETTVEEASTKFSTRAKSYDTSQEELATGLWILRRKSWVALKMKLEEEMMEGNLLLKLRENFEDKFRYDEAGVPRIWRPSDDIEGLFTKARESTLALLPLLARFELSEPPGPPPLAEWLGTITHPVPAVEDMDLVPVGGVDSEEEKSFQDEITLLSDAKEQDVIARFKKTADGIYVEAKRSAVGGITQVPLYFYGLLLALGWNEILAGMLTLLPRRRSHPLRNPHSASKPTLLHSCDTCGCRGLRYVYPKPVGSDVEYGQCGLLASFGRIQEEATRVSRIF